MQLSRIAIQVFTTLALATLSACKHDLPATSARDAAKLSREAAAAASQVIAAELLCRSRGIDGVVLCAMTEDGLPGDEPAVRAAEHSFSLREAFYVECQRNLRKGECVKLLRHAVENRRRVSSLR